MAEAIKYDILDTNAGKWLRDIARAIKLLSDALCQIHKCDKWCDINSEPERYLAVSMKSSRGIIMDISKKKKRQL